MYSKAMMAEHCRQFPMIGDTNDDWISRMAERVATSGR
jgi:hypothetical protein